MQKLFDLVDSWFIAMAPVTDFLWSFPTNWEWYANIPVIGKFPFAIVLLVGMGIYFTVRTRGVQFRFFKAGIKSLMKKKKGDVGVSPLASFLLSTAMRVGPGNLTGVTGAVAVGGPGAIFWMWMSALFGMASSFIESTLSQIFKEKDGDEYVGGLPYYGQKLLGNKKWIGILLAVSFIAYAMSSIPIQTFHVFTATGKAVQTITGVETGRTSVLYYAIAVILIVGVAAVIFGGIKRVTAITDKMVPVMAVIYGGIILILVVLNIQYFPSFLQTIVVGAFKPQAVFGGGFGVVLSQGIKRGLLSNEAGQGTITMSAAVAEQDHPCSQGFIQSIGVFLDTIVICTLTGYVVCGAHLWDNAACDWETLKSSTIDVFLQSAQTLVPGTGMDSIVAFIICVCYALFAFTTLLGLVSFAVIAGTRITKSAKCTNLVRVLGSLIFVPIGVLCVLSGQELDNLWNVTDFINIALVFVNAPVILIGAKYAYAALKDYMKNGGESFVSADIGLESEIWKK
ncbi:MAG: alanine:cation symporter family protein [Lachnospiraceae bacterium]